MRFYVVVVGTLIVSFSNAYFGLISRNTFEYKGTEKVQSCILTYKKKNCRDEDWHWHRQQRLIRCASILNECTCTMMRVNIVHLTFWLPLMLSFEWCEWSSASVCVLCVISDHLRLFRVISYGCRQNPETDKSTKARNRAGNKTYGYVCARDTAFDVIHIIISSTNEKWRQNNNFRMHRIWIRLFEKKILNRYKSSRDSLFETDFLFFHRRRTFCRIQFYLLVAFILFNPIEANNPTT